MSDGYKFAFYEYVEIRRGTYKGQIGVIFGRSDLSKEWPKPFYAVYINSECISYRESSLRSINKHGKRSDFYDGKSIKVQVDKDGNGTVV